MDPVKVWIQSEDTMKNKLLWRLAYFAKFINSKPLARWAINKISFTVKLSAFNES